MAKVIWIEGREFPEIEGNILSTVLSTIPGANHVHLNRLQMASNFLKQAINLKHAEEPLLRTPYLRAIGEHSTMFAPRAKCNGIVLYAGKDGILIECQNEKKYQDKYQFVELHPAPMYIPLVQAGQTVKKGQFLARHVIISDNLIPKIGIHLRTAWSFAIKGAGTFEDAIVVSESARDKLVSFEVKSYFIELNKPYVEINPALREGVILDKDTWLVKQYNNVISQVPESEERLQEKSYIYSINTFIFDEKWATLPDHARQFLNHYSMDSKLDRWYEKFCNSMAQLDISEKQLKKQCQEIQKYLKLKKRSVMHHQRRGSALRAILIVNVFYTDILKKGDKLANRYGNKGVVSHILSDEEIDRYMLEHSKNYREKIKPVRPDFVPEIIVNPYGVHSRMNPMQLAELNLLYIQKYVAPKIVENIARTQGYREAVQWVVSEIIEPLSEKYAEEVRELLAEQERLIGEQIYEQIVNDILVNGLILELEPFEDRLIYRVYQLTKKLAPELLIDLDKLNKLDPVERIKELQKLYGFGIGYWLKLEHRVETKWKIVGSGPYNKKNGVPTEGYRFGEMESWTMLAHDAVYTLQEFFGPRADDHTSKAKMLQSIIETGEPAKLLDITKDGRSQAYELFADYMSLIGIDMHRLVKDLYYGDYLKVHEGKIKVSESIETSKIEDNGAIEVKSNSEQIILDTGKYIQSVIPELKQLVDKSITQFILGTSRTDSAKDIADLILSDSDIDEIMAETADSGDKETESEESGSTVYSSSSEGDVDETDVDTDNIVDEQEFDLED